RGVMSQQLARSGIAAAAAAYLGRTGHSGALVVDESIAERRFDRPVESTAYLCLVDALHQLSPPVEVELGASDGRLTLVIGGAPTDGGTSTAWGDRLESLGGSANWTRQNGRAVVAISIPTEPAPSP
ncbi:MAG: hypothetical protein ACRDP2_03530, partial [Nocardioidaceae bacterium]